MTHCSLAMLQGGSLSNVKSPRFYFLHERCGLEQAAGKPMALELRKRAIQVLFVSSESGASSSKKLKASKS